MWSWQGEVARVARYVNACLLIRLAAQGARPPVKNRARVGMASLAAGLTLSTFALFGYTTPARAAATSWAWSGWMPASLPTESTSAPISLSGSLNAVTCSSASHCLTVGAVGLAETSDDGGRTWSRGAMVSAVDANGVACPTPDRCVAVGSSGSNTNLNAVVVSNDGGRTWTAATAVPQPATAAEGDTVSQYLWAVACPTSTTCVAVGSMTGVSTCVIPADEYNGTPAQTYSCTDTYNEILLSEDAGATWVLQTVPQPTDYSGLSGISCPTATVCLAVGFSPGGSSSGGVAPEVLLSDDGGQSWTLVNLARSAAVSSINGLTGVACASADLCVAVGSGFILLSTDGGAAWSRANIASSPPAQSALVGLVGVACPLASTCIAVGSKGVLLTTDAGQTWVAPWEDAAYFLVFPGEPEGEEIAGIACPVATSCVLVGFSPDGYFGPVITAAYVFEASPVPAAITLAAAGNLLGAVTVSGAVYSAGGLPISGQKLELSTPWGDYQFTEADGFFTIPPSLGQGICSPSSPCTATIPWTDPPVVGTATVVTSLPVLSLANASAAADGTAQLQATLTEDGSGLSGEGVVFTVDGRFAGSAMTDAAGVATLSVNLSGLSAGLNYPISAGFNGFSASANLTTVVQPSVILSAPSAVTSSTYTLLIPVPYGLATGDTVDVQVPTGTVLPTASSDYSLNGQEITVVQVSGETATVTVPSGVSEAPGGVATLTITDVTNPSAGQYTADVWTSRDTTAVASAPYSISGVTLTLDATPTPATVGQDVLLTALVSRPVSDGTITFAVPSGTNLSCVPHAGGCSVLWNTSPLAASSFTAGSWAVKVTWSGDTTYPSPASATMGVEVNSGMFISANPFPAVAGQAVTLTAEGILPSLSGGSVTFSAAPSGGSVVTLGTCSVTSDSCTLQWTPPATEGDVTVFAKCTGGGCGAGMTANTYVPVETSSSSDVCTTAVVSIGSLALTSGSSGSVPISLSQIPTGCPPLASWHLTVTFDPSVLSVQGAVGGPEWPGVTVTAVKPGTIELTAPQSDGGATGSLLATLQVTAAGAAGTTSPLSLGAISLTGTNAVAISATGMAGSVNVVGSASVDLSVVPEVSASHGTAAGLSISVPAAVYSSMGEAAAGEEIAGYQLSVSASDPTAVRLDPASCPPPFTGCSANVDQHAGTETVSAAVYQGVAPPTNIAFVPVRLTGPVTEAVQVTTTLQSVVDQHDTALGTPAPVTVTLQRGAVYQACSTDGTPVVGYRGLSVADAVAALQYLVKLRQAGTGCGQVNPVALASLVPVGTGLGSTPSVADVVALLQYLVGLRGPHMNLHSGAS